MKIVVAIRQVPERGARIVLNAAGDALHEDGLQFATNEPDAYALEHALALRADVGGEVVAVSIGPERAASTLRDALAKGADRAIHVLAGSLDALAVARVLAAVVTQERADLMLAGSQSEDMGYGQTPVLAAGLLGAPHATLALQIVSNGAGLSVTRELEEGWRQNLDLPLPAVVAVQAGGIALSYATLMGIKRARTRELRTIPVAEFGLALAPLLHIVNLAPPVKRKSTQLLQGAPTQAAAALIDKLRHEVHIL
jgi:electron transfer flavoprotein beta subunit